MVMTVREWAMLVSLSLLWGGSFFFVEVLVTSLPTLTIVSGRVMLAALIMWGVLRVVGVKMRTDPMVWSAFFLMGLLNNVIPFGLIAWGQGSIASGLASILNATTPLATVLLAHVLTADEKLSANRLFGVGLGMVGVAVMIGPEILFSLDGASVAQVGILLAAISYAFAGIFGRRFKKMGVGPLPTATGQLTASSLILLPVTSFVDRPWSLPLPAGEVLLALVMLAAFSTALAYMLYFRLLASAGASNLSLVTFLIPVSAIALGVGLLGERLRIDEIIGALLIGAGLLAIDGRLWPWLHSWMRLNKAPDRR